MKLELSEEWELEPNWKDKVCQPVFAGNLAPRDARGILLIANYLVRNTGCDTNLLLQAMLDSLHFRQQQYWGKAKEILEQEENLYRERLVVDMEGLIKHENE